MQFFPLKIKDIRRETADCVSIAFDIPQDLKMDFGYKAGQYLTLQAHIEGEKVRRSYSICTSPLENEWRVAVKKVPEGVFSTFANDDLRVGDTLEVAAPEGRFGQGTEGVDSFVFFAAGSGITPIFSILKTVLEESETATCTLIYGNRNATNVIFREAIEGLKNRFLGRLQVFYVLSREKVDVDFLNGRIDATKMQVFIEKMPDILRGGAFFACGPEEMIEAVRETLTDKGVEKTKIYFELFGTNLGQKKAKQVVSDIVKCHATIQLDGVRFDVPMHEGENVLDAALAVGADLPFACKGGVCCTCRAKLQEGSVDMDVNFSLTEDEVAAGFILTCQAVPSSDKILVNFDVK